MLGDFGWSRRWQFWGLWVSTLVGGRVEGAGRRDVGGWNVLVACFVLFCSLCRIHFLTTNGRSMPTRGGDDLPRFRGREEGRKRELESAFNALQATPPNKFSTSESAVSFIRILSSIPFEGRRVLLQGDVAKWGWRGMKGEGGRERARRPRGRNREGFAETEPSSPVSRRQLLLPDATGWYILPLDVRPPRPWMHPY